MVSQKGIHEYLIKGLQFPYERNFKQKKVDDFILIKQFIQK